MLLVAGVWTGPEGRVVGTTLHSVNEEPMKLISPAFRSMITLIGRLVPECLMQKLQFFLLTNKVTVLENFTMIKKNKRHPSDRIV